MTQPPNVTASVGTPAPIPPRPTFYGYLYLNSSCRWNHTSWSNQQARDEAMRHERCAVPFTIPGDAPPSETPPPQSGAGETQADWMPLSLPRWEMRFSCSGHDIIERDRHWRAECDRLRAELATAQGHCKTMHIHGRWANPSAELDKAIAYAESLPDKTM